MAQQNHAAFLNRGPSIDWNADDGIYRRYKIWKQQCELLFTGPMSGFQQDMKCKYLLLWSGEQGLELYNSWGLSEDDSKELANYWEGFENFVKPQSNELIAAWELHQLKQESLVLEEFIAKLRTLVIEANFPVDQRNRFLRDHLVFGMNSDRVRKECLKEGNSLTLENAISLAKAEESATKQLQRMSSSTAEVNALKKRPFRRKQDQKNHPTSFTKQKSPPSSYRHTSNYSGSNYSGKQDKTCQNCLLVHRDGSKCPARNSTCYHCKRTGHYSRACKKNKKVHELETDDLSEEEEDKLFLGPIEVTAIEEAVDTVDSDYKKSLLEITLSAQEDSPRHKFMCKIDSGAEADIIPISVFKKLFTDRNSLKKPSVKLKAYGGTPVENIGTCHIHVMIPGCNRIEQIRVEVADVNGPVIIGNRTAQELGLLKLTFPISSESVEPKKLYDVKGKLHPFPLTKAYLLEEYKDVFDGIGCFPGKPQHIDFDPNVQPVKHPARKVPIHMQEQYKEQLSDLVNRGILKKVNNEYTPWINSTVLTTKSNGKIRMCLDPRDLNKALLRNQYYMRTVDDVIPEVSDATHFTILDARNGFWQVKLDDDSSKLCTFSTPWGKYRWTRLPFGLSVSSDIFQEKMDKVFGHLIGLTGIADDTFIYGKSEIQHDQHVINALDTARENNIKFNPEKFQFKTEEASFFGLKWTPQGIKPDEKKIKAIKDMPRPTNITEVQSFMGMINYLNRFSPAIAEASEPIRQLMKKNTPFVWEVEHGRSFQDLKQIITESPVLSYYDAKMDNLVQTDASLKGLGCVLLQEGKPVCYASRSLNDAEKRYSNIERELLAIVWALEKLNHYVYGKHTLIETDHKPLESIWKKTIESASPRLQRLLLRLAKYDIDISYIPGKKNVVADVLSRYAHMENAPHPSEAPTIDIDTVTKSLPATPSKLEEIKNETQKDQTLNHLKDIIFHGWPEHVTDCPPDLKDYWTYRESLSVENGIILKGHRILMPPSLRQQTLNLIHQGHLGTEKCILKARDSVFWPKISSDIKQLTTECRTCQQFAKKQPKEPLISHNIPSYPWQKLGADLFDYKGNQYLLVSDYYSKFPVARKLDSLTAAVVIQYLKSVFAEYGVPAILVTDNGPQFRCREFETFCIQWGINHHTSSPLYPQSNGHIERMVQTVKNLLKKSEVSGEDPYLALLTYRTTPVDSKLPSPATLLNNRKYRTQLPCSGHLQRNESDDTNMDQLERRQIQQKQQYDKHASKDLTTLVPKQQVNIYVPKTKQWTPATVKTKLESPRSYSVVTPEGMEYRRNRAHLRPTHQLAPASLPTSTTTSHRPQTPQPKPSSQPAANNITTPAAKPTITTSGRVIKPPQKLDL